MRIIPPIILLMLLPVLVISAHEEGKSFEVTEGKHRIDIGYDVEEFISGQAVRFDFNLYEVDKNTPAVFTDLWVRIESGNKITFAGPIARSKLGPTGITYVLPESGEYALFVRFENGAETLVETSISFSILPGESDFNGKKIAALIAVIFVAAFSVGYWSGYKR